MEYYNKILCVTFEDLTGGDDPIMSLGALKSMLTRHRIDRVKRGGGEGGCALIVYSSLPQKYKTRFEEKKGDPVDIMKKEQIRATLKLDDDARKFYADEYTYDMNGIQTHLDTDKIEEYTLNASVLNFLIREQKRQESLSKKMNNPRRNVWEILQGKCEILRDQYGHTLQQSLARLKEKISQYRKGGYPVLISGKIGNKNTLKITEEGGKQLVALKRSRVPVYTDAQIFDEYNRIALEKGWKPLKSQRSMSIWLSSPAVEPLWHDAVFGELSSRQRFNRLHKTELPQRRDSLWYGDGTKLNLYYQDEQGKMRTLNVYEVIDAYSEVLLGYHISETEDSEAQYHAYRMAVQVSGHKPYEIVHDNQGGHKKADSTNLFSKICHVHRTTAPYSGQSKTIESVFGRFQMQVLHKDWRFTGQNITAKKESSRPNIEFIEANKDQLYTLQELKEAYSNARREWNEGKHSVTGKARIEMYRNSVNEETPEITPENMVNMFWMMTKDPVTFTASGIEITVKKQKYRYEVFSSPGVPDHEWRRTHTLQQFYVMYDPYDFGSVRLFWKDKAGKLRFERVAEPYMVIHRAIQDQTEGEAAFIRQEQQAAVQDRIERQVAAKEIEYAHGVAPEQHGLSTPDLKGLTKEQQREIDRRTKKYSYDPEEFQIGRRGKVISNITWDQLDGEISFDQRKTAGKL